MQCELEECGDTAKKQFFSNRSTRRPEIFRRSAPPSVLILCCTLVIIAALTMTDVNNSHYTPRAYPIPIHLKPQVGKLINLGRKAVNCNTQKSFLQASLNQQSIPNGIIGQMTFTPSIHDHKLSNLCDDIMNDAGSRILETMISYYINRGTNLREAYYSNLHRIKSEIPDNEYQEIVKVVDRKLQSQKLSCNKRHYIKLKRDLEQNKKYIPKSESHLKTTANNVFKIKQRRRKSRNYHKPHRFTKSKHKRNKVKGQLPVVAELTSEKMKDTVINLTEFNCHQSNYIYSTCHLHLHKLLHYPILVDSRKIWKHGPTTSVTNIFLVNILQSARNLMI